MAQNIKKFVCLHGHFYQPPRENPWLEEIEIQDSAAPFANWNERVCAECYAPNSASRILDDKGNIVDIINNYSKISFNFGPTLLIWLQKFQPDVYAAIIEADRVSVKNFSGHGAAIAQAYNHMILPLCNERDLQTQVIWGIRDFEARFGRRPRGMWLPETAVNTATLECLAENEIAFTVLSPRQARQIRKIGQETWTDVKDGLIDSSVAYACPLPSGKRINIFFYDGPISHDIAFAGLLNNGENFARRLLDAFPKNAQDARLVHAATDGESYGHHHRFGNMALSYCLYCIEKDPSVRSTVYSEFLELYPPQHEVRVHENSSWSCAHGVERWRSNCGCRISVSGGHQQWRMPLREAFDWLRDSVAPLYEKEMLAFCQDPWLVRDEYIQVVLDRSSQSVEQFFNTYFQIKLAPEEKIRVLKLLELQRHAMFMYTSCGWFFDDISGIETVQILQYAARVIQLTREITGLDLEEEMIKLLEQAPCNITELGNGAEVYRRYVKPAKINVLNVGIHFAISSVFERFSQTAHVYSYSVHTSVIHEYEIGKHRLLIGSAQVRSLITREQADLDFAVLYFGDYNVTGGVRYHETLDSFHVMHHELHEHFLRSDIPQVITLMNQYFGKNNYSLWDLFKNEQGKVLNQIFESTMDVIGANFREIYEHYYPLMRVRPGLKISLPKALAMTVEFVLNRDIIAVLEDEQLDLDKLERIAQEIKRWTFTRDKEPLSFVANQRIEKLTYQFYIDPQDVNLCRTIATALRVLRGLSLNLDLWKSQNYFFILTKSVYPAMKSKAAGGNEAAHEWVASFENLGRYLKVAIN